MSKGRMQKAERRKARHSASVARRIEKKQTQQVHTEEVPDDEDLLSLEEGDELEEVLPPEEADETENPDSEEEPEEVDLVPSRAVRKDMGEMAMTPGPTSFDELDMAQEAAMKASAVREVSWAVSDLVYNIMRSPMDAKAKSAAVQKVGSDFGERVSAIVSEDEAGDVSKSLDMDLLYTEAVIASDERHLSTQERIADWLSMSKEVLSSASRNSLGDSSFALVYTDSKGNKVRKYPIHDKAHVRNALARLAQMIKRGGAAAADARKAMGKVHAAAKRMGIGMGKSNDANAIVVEKDAKGDWRWVGWASNNFLDRQGQVLAKAAHEDYVQWLDGNPALAPVFMTWHTPGTARTNPVDYWAFEKGFLILSGKLVEKEAANLLKAQAVTDIGLSVAGIGLSDKSNPQVITKYRLAEVSDLPLENAANPFTGFTMFAKEADMDKQKYLAEIIGADAANDFLKKTGMLQEELTKAGVTQKEATPPAEPEPKTAPAAAPAAPLTDVQTLTAQVLKELDADGLNAFVVQVKETLEKVPVLEALVKDMQGNRDEELAKKIAPPAAKWAWASEHRASEAEETKITKEDKLAKSTPGLGDNWLNGVTGTQAMTDEEVSRVAAR